MAEATALRNNALPYPIYGAPFTVAFPMLDADGDLVTGASTPDAEISKNGDTFADCTAESVEIATSSGVYYLSLTGTELTCDVAAIIAKSATAGMKTTTLVLYPRKLVTIRSGTSQAGAATTITLDSGASAVDDFYNGMVCIATIDTLVEVRVIGDYVGSTKVATITGPNWNVTPDSDDTFVIKLPEGVQVPNVNVSHWLDTAAATPTVAGVPEVDVTHWIGTAAATPTTAGVPEVDLTFIAGAAVSTSTAQLGVNVVNAAGTAWASGAITAASIAADAIGASELAADAATEIANAVWALDATGQQTAGTFGKALGDPLARTNSLMQSVPDAVAGAAGGLFIAGTNAATTITTALTTTFTGNLTGSVGSVIGAVGSVTGAVGSVTGNVGGNVVGSVASVTGNVVGSVGSVTGLTAATVHADLDDIQARLPAALIGGRIDANIGAISSDSAAADNLEAYYDGTVGGYGGQAAYGGARIWMDTGAGAAGTTNYVHGTMTNPNSSMANSRTLANALDITAFHIANGSTITLDQGYNNFTFFGEEWNLALANRAIGNSRFEGAVVTGLSTGSGATFTDCHMDTCTLDPCRIDRSEFTAGSTITIGTAGTYTFNLCHSETPSGSEPTLDFGAVVGATTISNALYAGSIIIANLKAGDIYTHSGWGRLTLAASCTAGEVRIAGNVNLVNNGSGMTILDTSRYNEDQNVTNVTGNVNGNVVGSVGSVAAGGITAASIATDAIDDDAIATGAIASTAFAAGAINAAAIADGAIDAATFAAGAITAAAVATGAIDADALATDAVNEIADGVWDEAIAGHLGAGSTGLALSGATAPTAAAVADAVWDEAIAGHLGAGSTGLALNSAGAAGDPWSTAIPGAYGAGTAGHRLGNVPDLVAGAAGGLFIAGTNAATTITTALTTTFTGNLTGSVASVTGAVGSVTGAVGSVTGAVGSVTGLTNATIADAVWDETMADHLTPGSTGAALNAATAPSAAAVADAVWDEAIVGHLGAGSTGAALNAAGAAGDPWSTPIPGAYGAGTAGLLVGTNLNTTVSSRASQTSVNALPTETTIWEYILEGTLSAAAVMRINLAALAGKLSGAAGVSPFTLRFRDRADTVDRIVATTDVDGNRTNVTVDGS